MRPLSEQTILITGATDGLGRALASELAREGTTLLLHGRDEEKGERTVAEIGEASGNGRLRFLRADLASLEEVRGLGELVLGETDRLDVLVNNAGITKDGLILRMDDEDFDSVINTNLKSAFVAIRSAARPMMRSKGGRIINISSVSGVAGNAGQANYAASKAGLIGLSKSVAKELAGKRAALS